MAEDKHLKRKIKILLLMADNDGDKEENLKFLLEFNSFRDEYDEEDVPDVLRNAVWNAEQELKIQDLTAFKKDSRVEWNDNDINSAIFRDNDKRGVREMFCEEYKYWRPLFGYKEREKLAMEYCKCKSCSYVTKKRLSAEEGYGDLTWEDFLVGHNMATDKEERCTKCKFYLPYVERDDDEGAYPEDSHYMEETVPALAQGIEAMEEGMREIQRKMN